MPEVLHADVELFLVRYLRERLADADLNTKYPITEGVEVTNREPRVDAVDFPEKLVVVRDDSGNETEVITADRSIGVSTLAGNTQNVADASLLARIVHALTRDCAAVETGNPVAAVTQSSGPYTVQEDQPRARFYSVHTLSVVGEAL